MPTLVVKNREGVETRLDAQTGISLMENIRDLDASVDAICGGLCSCATCHVFVSTEWTERLPGRSPEETMLLENSESFDAEQYATLMRTSNASLLVMSIASSNVAIARVLRVKYRLLRIALGLALIDLLALGLVLSPALF